jgi:hypothetical protein
MAHIFKSLLLRDLGSIGNQYVNFYPLNIEQAQSSPPYEGGVAAVSADGVVLSFTRSIPGSGDLLNFYPLNVEHAGEF